MIGAFRALLYEHAHKGSTLAEIAGTITVQDIGRHLYTAGQPDPDLVIRTSGTAFYDSISFNDLWARVQPGEPKPLQY